MKAAVVSTALVTLMNNKKKSKGLRALCDGGSQVNLILARTVRTEGWKTQRCLVRVGGVDNGISCDQKLILQILDAKNELVGNFDFFVVQNLPLGLLPKKQLHVTLSDVVRQNLSDPSFETPAKVDMILGADVLAWIMGQKNELTLDGFLAQDTRLGWLVSGGSIAIDGAVGVGATVLEEEDLHSLLQKFWELEEIPLERVRTEEERKCEEIFVQNVNRDAEGRYEVKIPFRDTVKDLGSSREIALSRFLGLERRFKKDPDLSQKYRKEMEDMIEAGYLIKCLEPPKGIAYYIPHHAVLDKFRIVNDASCKTDRGVSLNQVQMVGEKLQDALFWILLRFRMNPFAFTADIRKMYLQVKRRSNGICRDYFGEMKREYYRSIA